MEEALLFPTEKDTYMSLRCHQTSPCRWLVILALLSILLTTTDTPAAEPTETWLDPEGIQGSLIIGGGGSLPGEIIDQFIKLAGGA